jgi:hypothetical protein
MIAAKVSMAAYLLSLPCLALGEIDDFARLIMVAIAAGLEAYDGLDP